MGSKGERQDGLAGVGVNRVPPGFARPRAGAPLLAGLPAGSLRTLLTIRRSRVGRGLGGPLDCAAPMPIIGFEEHYGKVPSSLSDLTENGSKVEIIIQSLGG
jgi:hypothetical protein